MGLKASDLVLVLLSIIFPPAAVAVVCGLDVDLIINLLLTLLAYVPGLIHAFWILYLKFKTDEQREGSVRNNLLYPRYFVKRMERNTDASEGSGVLITPPPTTTGKH